MSALGPGVFSFYRSMLSMGTYAVVWKREGCIPQVVGWINKEYDEWKRPEPECVYITQEAMKIYT